MLLFNQGVNMMQNQKHFAGSWNRVYNSSKNHKLFIHKPSGRLSIADQSAELPHDTDCGVLWINTDSPMRISEYGGVSIKTTSEDDIYNGDTNNHHAVISMELACFLMTRYDFIIKVGEKYSLTVGEEYI